MVDSPETHKLSLEQARAGIGLQTTRSHRLVIRRPQLVVALRELVRDVARDQLRNLREEMLEAIRAHDRAPPMKEPASGRLLTVEQVAQLLKVISDTVRTWIQALTASRPGSGARPGRKYCVCRVALDAFVASQKAPASPKVVSAAEAEGKLGRDV